MVIHHLCAPVSDRLGFLDKRINESLNSLLFEESGFVLLYWHQWLSALT